MLYTEYPCKAGAIVDVHPGAADPRAIERLAQVRAELDRSAARREAQRSLDAARRAEAVRVRAEMDAFQGATEPMIAYPDVAYGPVYGYYGNNLQGRAHRARPPGRLDHHRFDAIGASNARFRPMSGAFPPAPRDLPALARTCSIGRTMCGH